MNTIKFEISSPENISYFVFDCPIIKNSDIKNAVPLLLRKYYPFTDQKIVSDFIVVKKKLIVFVAPSDYINKFHADNIMLISLPAFVIRNYKMNEFMIITKGSVLYFNAEKNIIESSVYSDKSKLIEFLDKWNLNSFSDRVKFFITDDVPSDIISFIESRFKYFIKLEIASGSKKIFCMKNCIFSHEKKTSNNVCGFFLLFMLLMLCIFAICFMSLSYKLKERKRILSLINNQLSAKKEQRTDSKLPVVFENREPVLYLLDELVSADNQLYISKFSVEGGDFYITAETKDAVGFINRLEFSERIHNIKYEKIISKGNSLEEISLKGNVNE